MRIVFVNDDSQNGSLFRPWAQKKAEAVAKVLAARLRFFVFLNRAKDKIILLSEKIS